MIFGSLFSGIGGIDLGLERAGMECIWQVENDEYCTRVLEKHWPEVQRFGNIRECTDLPPVDLIAGGFPCQPHSVAGKRRGAEDDRNLWPEFIRVVRELKPRYVLAENVPGIITTYIDTVLSDLESEGYTCATFNLPAVAFDAPHRRERIFIVAYRVSVGRTEGASERIQPEISQPEGQEPQHICKGVSEGRDVAHRVSAGLEEWQGIGRNEGQEQQAAERGSAVADTDSAREASGGNDWGMGRFRQPITNARDNDISWWSVEPNVGRVAHGIPSRVDRLRGLGNAVVPQVAEWIGERILEFDERY